MISFIRVSAIVIQYLHMWKRDLGRHIELFFWSSWDLLVFAGLASWFNQSGQDVKMIMLTTMVLKQAFVSSSLESSYFMLFQDMISGNLVNLFASPLRFSELITAMMICSTLKSLVVLFLGFIFNYFLFGVSILSFGWAVIPFFIILTISGISVGFVACALLIRFGTRMLALIWPVTFLVLPLCGNFFPVAVLPKAARCISYILPMAYAFEGVRGLVSGVREGLFWAYDLSGLIVGGLLLSVAFLFITSTLFFYLFKKSKQLRLSRLIAE